MSLVCGLGSGCVVLNSGREVVGRCEPLATLQQAGLEPATRCQTARGGTQEPLILKRALPQQKQPGAGCEDPLRSSALAAAGLGPCPSGYCSPVCRSDVGFVAPWFVGCDDLWCRCRGSLEVQECTLPFICPLHSLYYTRQAPSMQRDISLWRGRSYLR